MTNTILDGLDRCAGKRRKGARPAEVDTLGVFTGFGTGLLETRTEMSKGGLTVSLAHVNLFGRCKLKYRLIEG